MKLITLPGIYSWVLYGVATYVFLSFTTFVVRIETLVLPECFYRNCVGSSLNHVCSKSVLIATKSWDQNYTVEHIKIEAIWIFMYFPVSEMQLASITGGVSSPALIEWLGYELWFTVIVHLSMPLCRSPRARLRRIPAGWDGSNCSDNE